MFVIPCAIRIYVVFRTQVFVRVTTESVWSARRFGTSIGAATFRIYTILRYRQAVFHIHRPMAAPLLFIGLGNPGIRYAPTRHNIGFMVVDAVAEKFGLRWDVTSALHDTCEWRHAGRTMVLAKPKTYMNDSGRSARKLAGQLGIGPADVVAIVDEYNFPVGRIHLKAGGSDGGHNGITSLMTELKSAAFWRLRCGIDRRFGPGGLVDYVLAPFPSDDSDALASMITDAVAAVELIARVGPERAMQTVNRPKESA